jgi:CubicO group peptidase (beta-lactamase class C family)
MKQSPALLNGYNGMMRKAFRGAMLLVLSLPITLFPAEFSADVNSHKIDAFLEAVIKEDRVPGLAVAIIQRDRIVYLHGFGVAGNGRAITPQTALYVGSISKSITGLAVMQLVEAGKVRLDSAVCDYIPWFTLAEGRASSRITVRDLLNQVSGITDTAFAGQLPPDTTLEECIRAFTKVRPAMVPGAGFRYSNMNYRILGLLVETVSGESFAEYLGRHIFMPLEMTHTTTSPVGVDLAQGYIPVLGFPVAVAQRHLTYAVPSGYIISTAEDMAHYLIAQVNKGSYGENRVLSPRGMGLMHASRSDLGSPYAMGWFESKWNSTHVIRHSGDLDTFHADAILLPERGYGVVLLYNLNGFLPGGLVFPEVAHDLTRMLTGELPQHRWSSAGATALLAAIMAVSLGLEVVLLLTLPRWRLRMKSQPMWRRNTDIAWALVFPAMPVLALVFASLAGWISSMRFFFLRAPDVCTWLCAWSAIAVTKGVARALLGSLDARRS